MSDSSFIPRMSDSSFILYADQVVSINLGDDGATLTNAGSATISYADSEAAARSAPQGTIVPAASVDLAGTQFLKAAARTELKVEALPSQAVESGSSAPTIVTAGNLGTTSSQTIAAGAATWLTGTLNANHVMTVTLGAASELVIDLTQDATGGRTFRLTDGVTTLSLAINAAAGAASHVEVRSPDGVDFYVSGAVATEVEPPIDPLSLSPAFWLKADALALANNDPVASWTDSSGNARHAVQASAPDKPLYKTNVLNGLPVLRFADDSLAIPAFTHGDIFTVFIVAKATVDDTHYLLSSTHFWALFGYDPPFYFRLGAGANHNVNTTKDAFHVLVGQRLALSGQAWVDGVGSGSASSTADTPASDPITIGRHLAGVLPLAGDIAEILFYPTALSSPNRLAVQQVLADKYAITVA